MYIEKVKNENEIEIWLEGLNHSFRHRKTEKILYKRVEKKDILINSNALVMGVYDDIGNIIGGGHILYGVEYEGVHIAKISHVWVDVQHQNQGVGKFLIKGIEQYEIERGTQLLQLNVSSIYLPAIYLYKQAGFKKYKIYANVPKTYYFIRMIKSIGKYKFPEKKRIYEYFKSVVIFMILYKKDSTPTIINKEIYCRLKKNDK